MKKEDMAATDMADEIMHLKRRVEQWQRCFNLAFALKNKYHEELRRMTVDRDSETRWACQYKAERDEIQAKLDRLYAIVPSGSHWMHCCQCGRIMEPRSILDIQECPNCFSMLQEIPGQIIDILHPKEAGND